jgi:hypothetical protein
MARPKTIQLKETKTACPPGATIIDAEFVVIRAGKKRRRRSWFLLMSLTVFAAALGGMAGFFAPDALAQVWSKLALG